MDSVNIRIAEGALFVALALFWGFAGPVAYNSFKSMQATENTYEQQYPGFDNIAETLQTRFTTHPSIACTSAILQHPAEKIVEWWLYRTLQNNSLNLLFYGEAMLGKSCTVRKVLDKLSSQQNIRFFYHMYYRGFDEFVTDLCEPAIIGPDKQKAVFVALEKYAKYVQAQLLFRKEFYEDPNHANTKLPGKFDRYNALIVLDFVNYNDAAALESLSKTIHDLQHPIRFVFIASEARAPAIFQRRVRQVRLTEGDDELARNYLREIVGMKNTTQIDSIVQSTGSIFKYLDVVKEAWLRTSGDIEATKEAVYEYIQREIGFLLSPSLYPEVVEICKQLVAHNNTLSTRTVDAIVKRNSTAPLQNERLTVREVFEQNLFLVDKDKGVVRFQNRATAHFVSLLLSQISD